MLLILLILSFFIFLISPLTIHATVDFKLLFITFIQPIILILFFKAKHHFPIKKNINYNILIFLALIIFFFTYWNFSKYPYYSTRIITSFWSSILCFLSGIFILNENNLKLNILKSIVIISALSSIYVIFEYFGFIKDLQIHKFPVEVTGHVGHKNIFGFISMVSLIINLSFLRSKSISLFYKSTPFLIFCALLLCDSRGSLALSVIGVFAYLIPTIISNNLYKNFKFRLLFYITVIFMVMIPIYFWNEQTIIRIAKLFVQNSIFSHRSEIYKAQLSMIYQNPFFGNGMGSFIHENLLHSTKWYRENYSFLPKTLNGHCEYLEILTEYGIIGALLYFYFWIGALYNGIKKIKNKWNNFDYSLLVSLILMMVHASFSVASKRLPSSGILWLLIGYFWYPHFYTPFFSIKEKYKTYTKIIFSIFSLIIFIGISKVLIGDYFYKTSTIGKSMNSSTIKRLNKSINFYPNHPYSLFRISKFSIGVREYDYAIQLTDILNETSPNIFNSNYIKGEAFFFKEQMDSALIYADKELYYRNKHDESIFLKSKIYAFTNNEKELNKSKNLILYKHYNKKNKPKINFNPLEVDKKQYNKLVGPLRAVFSGPYLKIAWLEYKEFKNKSTIHKKNLNKKTLKLKTNLTTP